MGLGRVVRREGALQTCKPSQREATNLKLENSTLIAMPSSQSVRQAVQRGTVSSGTLVEFRSFSLRPGAETLLLPPEHLYNKVPRGPITYGQGNKFGNKFDRII